MLFLQLLLLLLLVQLIGRPAYFADFTTACVADSVSEGRAAVVVPVILLNSFDRLRGAIGVDVDCGGSYDKVDCDDGLRFLRRRWLRTGDGLMRE